MIKEIKTWYDDDVRDMCVKHNYYTKGDNKSYNSMLEYVKYHRPTTSALEYVAKDILEHSNDPENTVTNVMYQLHKEAVHVFFKEV